MPDVEALPRMPSPVRALAALLGLASLFVPFAFDCSPLRALTLTGDTWVYGGPAFLTLTITAGYLRSISPSGLSKFERVAYYVFGIAGIVAVLYPWIWSLLEDRDAIDLGGSWLASFALLLGPLILLLGGVLVLRVRRLAQPPEAPPVLLMRVVYLANAITCLILFAGEWQVGAWLVLAVTAVYVGIIVNVARAPGVWRKGER